MKVETRLLSFLLTLKILMTYFKDRKIALQEKKTKKKEHMLNYPRAVIFHEVVKEQQ